MSCNNHFKHRRKWCEHVAKCFTRWRFRWHRSSTVLSLALLLVCQCKPSRCDWVDPDTPQNMRSVRALTKGDHRQYELVFSDEFEQDGRTFHDGNDPRWTAINKNDYTNAALHFYSDSNAYTNSGVLNITSELKDNAYKAFDEKLKKNYADKKHVQSGMVQSWNKFCFTGGIVEFRAKLPGKASTGGLWPALWLLGNLARATYVGSSNFMWPFSYNQCDKRTRNSQEIDACAQVNHYGLASFQGRGAPEIDIIEAMQGDASELPNTFIKRPYQSTSLQVAPGIENDRPVLGHRPHNNSWYKHLEYSNATGSDLNPFFYGVTLFHKPKSRIYQSDALSANLQLNQSFYDNHHLYRVEWEPPMDDGTGGYIKWFTDDRFVFAVYGESLKITKTEIPSEPMYLIMNTAVSHTWGFPMPCPDNCACDCYECGNPQCMCALPTGYCDNYPAGFEIDYVRVYQAVNESKHILGCSPEARPTALFIEGHAKRYMEDGQSRPLQGIRRGGVVCVRNEDCGGPERGVCSDSKVCQCFDGWTGPSCLAHAGFYDVDTSAHIPIFQLSSMVMPKGLATAVGILILGLIFCMAQTVRSKSSNLRYNKVEMSSGGYGSTQPTNTSLRTYQDAHPEQYDLQNNKKVLTYCVIDGRLVDA
ncbi:hypothetical protein MPSEU_000490600 [Mayamaea pseudoterrestris]|nr:hypothetical protein MPSEU_000490600 [Mayamaea pseudoterrestris]